MPITIKNVKDMPFYQGDHAIPGIRFRPARQEMGISAWGMNVLDFEPKTTGYPEHNHHHDGQEELYLILEGSLILTVDGVEHALKKGDMVRVPAESTRKFTTRESSASLLAMGATPGKSYEPDKRMATT